MGSLKIFINYPLLPYEIQNFLENEFFNSDPFIIHINHTSLFAEMF